VNDALGPWEPLPLAAAVDLFAEAPFRWWVSGGHALELHLGRSWRVHDDTDISIARRDTPALRAHLAGWDIQVAAAGVLNHWTGCALAASAHQNNLWCRRAPDAPWALDITIAEGDDTAWIFRRDPTLALPWDRAVLTSTSGVPYLTPELQLLFKASDRRPKDDVDAAEVIPELEASAARVLASWLPAGHPWRSFAEHAKG
jgi:hypothetical protein